MTARFRERTAVWRQPTVHAQLLTATERLLREQGPGRVTVTAVARAVGMSPANVYRFFPSKTALLEALTESRLRAREERLQQCLRLRHYVDELVARIRDFSAPPVIVAHSLGGWVSLQAARQAPLSALALLAAVPEAGLRGSLWHLARTSPLALSGGKFFAACLISRVSGWASLSKLASETALSSHTAQVSSIHRSRVPDSYFFALRTGLKWLIGSSIATLNPCSDTLDSLRC